MLDSDAPIVIAFDGSDEAQAAVRVAARLFRDRPLIVASVWEPGLAMVAARYPDALGSTYGLPAAEDIALVDQAQETHAEITAEAGAEIAHSLGAAAAPVAVAAVGDIAGAIETIAEDRDAAALVVGRRGLGAVKSTLLGSTSRALLQDARRPVVVVRAPR